MNPQPGVAAEAKKHLFGLGRGGDEFRAGQCAVKPRQVQLSQEFFLFVGEDPNDPPAMPRPMPAVPEKFDLGEFGHGAE